MTKPLNLIKRPWYREINRLLLSIQAVYDEVDAITCMYTTLLILDTNTQTDTINVLVLYDHTRRPSIAIIAGDINYRINKLAFIENYYFMYLLQ